MPDSTIALSASRLGLPEIKDFNLSIVATHDLELTERLNGWCGFYHFSGSVDENGLKFDYVLKPGVAITGNAIAQLEYLGYAREITQEAKRKDSSP